LAIVVVGGNGKNVGKTSVVCAVITALPEFEWTAVKITGHGYGPPESDGFSNRTIREESRAGDDTDTSKYLMAGARRALLVTGNGEEVPIEEIRREVGSDCNVIFESNRIVDVVRPDVCLAVIGGVERKASFAPLVRTADAVVMVGGIQADDLPEGVPHFELEAPDRLSAEMAAWLREQLIKHRPGGQIKVNGAADCESSTKVAAHTIKR
jgi:hypothetical protein